MGDYDHFAFMEIYGDVECENTFGEDMVYEWEDMPEEPRWLD